MSKKLGIGFSVFYGFELTTPQNKAAIHP